MNRKLLSLLVAFAAMFGCLGSVQAQEYNWNIVAPENGGQYYIYSTVQKKYLNDNNGWDVTATTLWTFRGSLNEFSLMSAGNKEVVSWVNTRFSAISSEFHISSKSEKPWANNQHSNKFATAGNENGYSFYRKDSWANTINPGRNLKSNNSFLEFTKDASNEFVFVSKEQYAESFPYPLTSWTAVQGNGPAYYLATGAIETYAGDNSNFGQGKVLYQKIEGLDKGYYKLELYFIASKARGESVNSGTGIAQTYVTAGGKTETFDMTVEEQSAINPEDDDWYRAVTVKVTDGTLEYGIQNTAEGGNWYVCKVKSVTYLGNTQVPLNVNTMGSFVAPFDVELPNGVTAWITTDNNSSDGYLTITQTAADGNLPANTPVILRGVGSQTYYGNATGTENENGNGFFVGVYEKTTVPQNNFVLQNQGDGIMLYKVESDDITLNAYRAYLNGSQFSGSKLRLVFSDETTGIATVEEEASVSAIYSASGAKLNAMQKGLNIIKMSNGSVKKVMVK